LDKYGRAESQAKGVDKSSWTISKRIMLLTMGGTAIILILGVVAMYALNMINNNSNTLVKENLSEWDLANKIETEARKVGHNLDIFSNNNDSTAWNKAEAGLAAINIQVDSARTLAKIYDLQQMEKR